MCQHLCSPSEPPMSQGLHDSKSKQRVPPCKWFAPGQLAASSAVPSWQSLLVWSGSSWVNIYETSEISARSREDLSTSTGFHLQPRPNPKAHGRLSVLLNWEDLSLGGLRKKQTNKPPRQPRSSTIHTFENPKGAKAKSFGNSLAITQGHSPKRRLRVGGSNTRDLPRQRPDFLRHRISCQGLADCLSSAYVFKRGARGCMPFAFLALFTFHSCEHMHLGCRLLVLFPDSS